MTDHKQPQGDFKKKISEEASGDMMHQVDLPVYPEKISNQNQVSTYTSIIKAHNRTIDHPPNNKSCDTRTCAPESNNNSIDRYNETYTAPQSPISRKRNQKSLIDSNLLNSPRISTLRIRASKNGIGVKSKNNSLMSGMNQDSGHGLGMSTIMNSVAKNNPRMNKIFYSSIKNGDDQKYQSKTERGLTSNDYEKFDDFSYKLMDKNVKRNSKDSEEALLMRNHFAENISQRLTLDQEPLITYSKAS